MFRWGQNKGGGTDPRLEVLGEVSVKYQRHLCWNKGLISMKILSTHSLKGRINNGGQTFLISGKIIDCLEAHAVVRKTLVKRVLCNL